MKMGGTQNISVLIPTYRRPQDLSRCLTALEAQTRPADEIVIVIRDADKETLDFLDHYQSTLPILRVCVKVPGVIAAMNAGLEKTTGDIVALTDDDTSAFPDWLERIETHFVADPKVGGVGGRDWQENDLRSRYIVGIIQWHGRVIGNHHLGVGEVREVDVLKGANCAYRTDLLKTIGFESRLRGKGAQVHWELALGLAIKRNGWKLVYDPKIALHHFIAQRQDQDLNHRGFFNAEGLSNSAYNETVILLTYLPFFRKLTFLIWAFLVGTWAEPGLVQIPRLLARRDKNLWHRLRATSYGRTDAIMMTLRKNQKRLK